ncbi:MAG: succinate--CoA ligase subunit alpha [Candidatus Heimdallarchaeota archaeon]|nr:succinate--CoA ligase subunit alpha [Candidatus Heimdallarchaeota archaeon]MDH5647414.1 succinate--CoA ligase subunit alpha [Candidatus Heimdallarchaeota archaeon]
MAVLLDKNTKVIVQGITGYQGMFHAKLMKEYGTQVVGGTRPGKGGEEIDGFPIFDSVREAMDETGATASVIFVPAKFSKLAAIEAINANIELLTIITEGVPVVDTMEIVHRAKKGNTRLIGPNCPGIITPGQAKIGIIPGSIVTPGEIGVVSRSGTLTYEVIDQLTTAGMGQSTCIGIGGDPIKMTNFIEALELFENDTNTKKIVMIGEIGGNAEELAADFIKEHVTKPVAGFIAGKTAREGKTMGHAGAIVHGNVGTAEGKIKALTQAGVKMADKLSDIPVFLK